MQRDDRGAKSTGDDAEWRTETDSLGSERLPQTLPYGIASQRALTTCAYTGQKLGDFTAYLRAILQIKAAAAEANALNPEIICAIETLLERIQDSEFRSRHFSVDPYQGGGSIALNQNVNEVCVNFILQNAAGITPETRRALKKEINRCQSTSDVCHTAARLAIYESLQDFTEELKNLAEAWQKKSQAFTLIQTRARTCLRDASVMSLGDHFSAYTSLLDRTREKLNLAGAELSNVALGGTAVGTGEGTTDAYRKNILPILSRRTGRSLRVRANLYDALQNSDDLMRVFSELALLSQGLLKIAKDLRLLSSGPQAGFNEIKLPAEMEGSSFYPGKLNPVLTETIMIACFRTLGAKHTADLASEQAELNLNVFEAPIVFPLLSALGELSILLKKWRHFCVDGIEVNEMRCKEISQ